MVLSTLHMKYDYVSETVQRMQALGNEAHSNAPPLQPAGYPQPT